ncbi:uncharacterized protein LOC126820662 [Patella vulgata]|uniref:uncharacterized protein LOC126820662 n=1 Tax=Patella vulgata TaxID=6465 RepID=UPI0024A8D198|nr:uncharacterized protein LOC126820662 [Patella vulgata]
MEIGMNTRFEVTGINVINDAIHEHDELSINENSSEICSDKVLNEIGGDVFLSHVETSNFFFHTLGLDEQIRICTQLNIVNRLDSNYSNRNRCPINQPSQIKSITGDGNCYFRSVSYAISGTEVNHRIVRLAVVNHLKNNAAIFTPYLRAGFLSVDDYLKRSRMRYLGSWATELEIYVCADLLQVDIYTYSSNRWLKFSKLQILDNGSNSIEGIYINHANQVHYEVVLNVASSNRSNDNDVQSQGKSFDKDIDHDNDIPIKPDETELKVSTKQKCRKRKRRGNNWNSRKKYTYMTQLDTDKIMDKQKSEYDRYWTFIRKEHSVRSGVMYRGNRTNRRRFKYKYNTDYKFKQICKSRRNMNYRLKNEYDNICDKLNHKYKFSQIFKDNLIKKNKERYRLNNDYREKLKKYGIMKYKSNSMYRDHLKSISSEKYKTNTEFQVHVKAQSKCKYETNEEFKSYVKEQSKYKYETNEEFNTTVKEQSKYNYKTNKQFQSHVNSRSQIKYRSDKNHRDVIKKQNKERKEK